MTKNSDLSTQEPTAEPLTNYPSPGTNALAWLTGDFKGNEKMQIGQPYDTHTRGNIHLCVYDWKVEAKKMDYLWHGFIAQPYASPVWLVGDVNLDGKDEIIQVLEDASFYVYGWNGTSMTDIYTGDATDFSGTCKWLTADLAGDGRIEVLQPWENGGNLSMNIFKWSDGPPNLTMTMTPITDMQEGWPNITFLAGDFDGDGADEIIQPWDNTGTFGLNHWLGLNYFKWNSSTSAFDPPWGNSNMNQGSGSICFLVADLNGDKQDELLQVFSDGGQFGVNVYQWNNLTPGAMEVIFTQPVGLNYDTQVFLTGDVNDDGQDELIQIYVNNGNLCMDVYLWNPGQPPIQDPTLNQISTTPVVGTTTSYASFLYCNAMKVGGSGQIYQQWQNGTAAGTPLSMTAYEWQGTAASGSMVPIWTGTMT